MSSLPKIFKLYLKNQGASPTTIKNYLSDFNHFLGWLILTLKSRGTPINEEKPQTVVQEITPQIVAEYKNFLLANKTPIRTINRRLSALRKFGQFCISQAWLKANPAKKVTNVTLEQRAKERQQSEQILAKFAQSLEKEKVSPITVKNYLSDLRHFLGWLEAT